MVRSATAYHSADSDVAERAVIGRTAEAARGRTRRFARCSRSLAARAEFAFQIRCGKLAARGHHLPRCHPGKSDVLALLQQPRANEQYRAFCSPWLVPRSRQGKVDA